MVKARQKNFRAFVFTEGDAQETIDYIEKNFILLKDFLLVFAYPIKANSTIPDSALLYDYLCAKNLNFIESPTAQNGESYGNLYLSISTNQSADPQSTTNKADLADSKLESQDSNAKTQPDSKEKNTQTATLIFHRTIRSGEEIITQGDLTIFGRINSGAHIQSEGNIQIFGNISGNIFCNGDYMILGKVGEGNVLFGGEILDKDLLQHNQNKIYRKQQEIIIEELK